MSTDSQSRQAMVARAASQLEAGAFEDAVEAFTAALLIEPEDAEAFRGRGMARFQLKNWKSAEDDFRRARELQPLEPENALGVALTLAMSDKIYPAFSEFETLLQKTPDFVRGYIQFAFLQIKIGAISKGKEILKEALKHRPTLAERRLIESTLNEQDKLDKRRYYRPDFEALRKLKLES